MVMMWRASRRLISKRTRFPAVDSRNVAVSDANGTSEFLHVVNAAAWSGLRSYAIMTIEPPVIERTHVRTVRLDDDLPEGYMPSLIKITVRGPFQSAGDLTVPFRSLRQSSTSPGTCSMETTDSADLPSPCRSMVWS